MQGYPTPSKERQHQTYGGPRMSEFMTVQEYATWSRQSVSKVNKDRVSGSGCPFVRAGKKILYRRSDAEQYLARTYRSTSETGTGWTPEERAKRRANRAAKQTGLAGAAA